MSTIKIPYNRFDVRVFLTAFIVNNNVQNSVNVSNLKFHVRKNDIKYRL